MGYEKVRELNEKILHKATEKLDKRVDNDNWENEEFEVISKSLDNILDIKKLEEKGEKERIIKATHKKINAETETTEFEQLIYDISKERNDIEGMLAITTILADHLEDVRIMNPRAYEMVMYKLKELLR